MVASRRQALEVARAGPALFAGLPGDEVELDRLAAHLIARGADAGIHVTDGSLEGILWIQDGAAGEAWFFEGGGPEAILSPAAAEEMLREIASRDGTVSVFLGRPPDQTSALGGVSAEAPPGFGEPPPAPLRAPFGAVSVSHSPVVEPAPPVTAPPVTAPPVTVLPVTVPPVTAPATAPPATAPPAEVPPPPIATPTTASPSAALPPQPESPVPDPQTAPASTRPWPAIIRAISTRVARQRGPKVAALFLDAVNAALREHGGRVEREQIEVPPLSEPVWLTILERGTAPVAAIAGRAFVDRTVAAATREVTEAQGEGSS